MTVSKEQIQNTIKHYRKIGLYDDEIMAALKKRNDPIGKAIKSALRDGANEVELAKDIGIDLTKKREAPKMEKPSFMADIGYGADGIVGGVGQGGRWVWDKITGDNSYDRYTTQKQAERDSYNKARQASGKGMNVGAFVGENLALAPTLGAGKVIQAGSAIVRGVGGLKTASKVANATKTAGTASKASAIKTAGKSAVAGGAVGAVGFAGSADERMENIGYGMMGGAIAPAVGNLAQKGVQAGNKAVNTALSKLPSATKAHQEHLAKKASEIVKNGEKAQGIRLNDEQRDIAIKTAKAHLKDGKIPDGGSLVRKSVLDSHNIKGTKAQVSGSATDYTAEREFAKKSDGLINRYNQQSNDVGQMMSSLADGTGQQNKDLFSKTQDAFNSLKNHDKTAKEQIKNLYGQARGASGNDLAVDYKTGLPNLQKQLRKGGFMEHYSKIHNIIKGNVDEHGNLTLLGAENAKKALNHHFTNGRDGAKDRAFGLAKQALDDWVQKAGDVSEAKQAWEIAKGAYRQHAKDSDIPFFKAVLSGGEPDKAFDKFIIKGAVNDVKNLRAYLEKVGDKQTLADLQGATIEHILSVSNTQNGFSVLNFKKALNSLNDHKLHAILDEKQVAELKEIGKVADILFKAPPHNAVNHSNTAFVSDVLNSALARVVGKLPFGGDKLIDGATWVFNNRITKKYLNGDIPAIGKYEQQLLKKSGVSDDLIKKLSNPVIPSAVAVKQANQEDMPVDEAYHDSNDGYADHHDNTNTDTAYVDYQDGVSQNHHEATDALGGLGLDFTAPKVADYLPSGDGADVVADDGMPRFDDGEYEQGGYEQVEVSPHEMVAGTLSSFIRPPANHDDMPYYEQYVNHAIGQIMQTPQMEFILGQMASDNPDYERIEKAQKSLSHTPEWLNFMQNVDDSIKAKVRGANILALLTNNDIHGNSGFFNPTF